MKGGSLNPSAKIWGYALSWLNRMFAVSVSWMSLLDLKLNTFVAALCRGAPLTIGAFSKTRYAGTRGQLTILNRPSSI